MPSYVMRHASCVMRIVYVFILDPATHKVGLAKRAASVSFCPLHYGTTASGHVESGEDWDTAARRETAEEIGLADISLTCISKALGTDIISNLTFMEAVYIGWSDPNALRPHKDEVDSIAFVDLQRARNFIDENPCHPRLADHIDILLRYCLTLPNSMPGPVY